MGQFELLLSFVIPAEADPKGGAAKSLPKHMNTLEQEFPPARE